MGRLTTPVERLEVLAQTRLDSVAILRFDGRLRAMDPEAFVREVPLERFAVRELVIGEDHGFGRGRAGDVAELRRLGDALGFTVDVVPPVLDLDGGAISSTRVRRALAAGELPAVARMLGRRYSLTAAVERGAGRGRTIGVPTANLRVPPRKQLPPDGVYAVRVEWAGGRAGGMLNQGPRRTVGDPEPTVEVHLFDVGADLYGREVRVEWVDRLRDIRRFESLEALGASWRRTVGRSGPWGGSSYECETRAGCELSRKGHDKLRAVGLWLTTRWPTVPQAPARCWCSSRARRSRSSTGWTPIHPGRMRPKARVPMNSGGRPPRERRRRQPRPQTRRRPTLLVTRPVTLQADVRFHLLLRVFTQRPLSTWVSTTLVKFGRYP